MNRKFIVYGLVVIMAFVSCDRNKSANAKSPILVEVYGEKLHLDEIDTATLSKLSGDDSLEFILQQENAWINEQILLKKAGESLSSNEKSLQKELDEYKNNLLLYAFRERLILDQLDTTVSEKEIENFYVENKNNFELKRNIAKILFVKVTEENYTDDLKVWMEDGSPSSLGLLKKFCEGYAENYFISDSVWLYFDDIWKEIPISRTYNRERFMNSNKFLTFEESPHIYLLKMIDFKIKNSLSPLEFERNKIREIILNKRKISLIKKREKEMIKMAYDKGEVRVLRDNK